MHAVFLPSVLHEQIATIERLTMFLSKTDRIFSFSKTNAPAYFVFPNLHTDIQIMEGDDVPMSSGRARPALPSLLNPAASWPLYNEELHL
jgi:hypothetical protein